MLDQKQNWARRAFNRARAELQSTLTHLQLFYTCIASSLFLQLHVVDVKHERMIHTLDVGYSLFPGIDHDVATKGEQFCKEAFGSTASRSRWVRGFPLRDLC